MNSPLVWVMVGYLNSIFLFFNQSSVLLFWCLLEINLILLISLFYYMDNQDKMMNSEQCLYYFMIQSLGSFMILASFKFSDMPLLSGLSYMLFSMAVVIKMGLWPFSSWVFNLSSSITHLKVFILLSIQKIPLFYLIFSFPSSYMYIILLSSFLVGSALMFSSMSTVEILVSSSIYSTVWVGYLFNNSLLIFFMYVFMYFFFLYTLLQCKTESPADKNFMLGSFAFFLGLPPLSLFFFKLFIANWIGGSLSSLDFLFFWLVSFLGLFGYSKMFFQYFFTKFCVYLNDEFFSQKMSFYLIPSSLFLLFLV